MEYRRFLGFRSNPAVALGLHPFGPKKFTRFSASTSRTSRLRRLSPSRQVTMSASPGLAVITTCRDVTIQAMWGNFQYSPAE